MTLLPVAEAQARILALASPLPPDRVPLVDAAGRFAASPLAALRDQPASDLSAMDGYAIRFAERPGPWRVVGESAAGAAFGRALEPGEATRIFTGAPMPHGADSVLIQEEAGRDGDRLAMTSEGPLRIGGNVRPQAIDFSRGTPLLARGDRITARHVALAAIAGHGTIAVGGVPRVALIATGDELAPPGAPIGDDRLPASNSPMLAALIGAHARVEDLGIVPDRLDAIVAAFRHAATIADVIVTTGGASVGDRDLVRPALAAAGAELDFWRVAMRPGKPLLAGRLDRAIVIGLPGNPVSAFVTATVFLRPLLAHLAGAADPLPRLAHVRLGAALPATGVRQDYLRAGLRDGLAYAPDGQDSAALVALARADGLIVRHPHAPAAAPGDSADFLPLD